MRVYKEHLILIGTFVIAILILFGYAMRTQDNEPTVDLHQPTTIRTLESEE